MNNIQLYTEARKYLGTRGAEAKAYCGLGRYDPYCAAYVSYIEYKGGNRGLIFGGKKVINCPVGITWCRANLAEIPIYMAMPMDVIFFDWNKNGTADHVGFVKSRNSDIEVNTHEGNATVRDKNGNVIASGIVAEKIQPSKYVAGCFRVQYKPTSFTTLKALVIDGQFDYNSIACLQLALRRAGFYKGKIDAILGKQTIRALQAKAGMPKGSQDGAWGMKTTKAIQKWLNIRADGWWGVNSTKSLQRWCNNYNEWYAKKHKLEPQKKPTPVFPVKPVVVKKDRFDIANEWAENLCKSPNGKYKEFTDNPSTQRCAICYSFTDPRYMGMNCINAMSAYWRHGAKIPCRCGPEVINNAMGDRILRSDAKTALELVKQCTGLEDVILLSEGGKAIPASKLKKGDWILYFEGDTFMHAGVHIGNGKLFDCARGHTPQMQCGDLGIDWWTKENGWQIKLAIRYTGK